MTTSEFTSWIQGLKVGEGANSATYLDGKFPLEAANEYSGGSWSAIATIGQKKTEIMLLFKDFIRLHSEV